MGMLRVFVAILVVFLISEIVAANAFVRGAYYRLGDDDPGAVFGAVGNDPTKDSFSDSLDLSRSGNPHYSSDIPANGPGGNKLSMLFNGVLVSGGAGLYSRPSLDMTQQGYALEAWVKSPDVSVASAGVPPELIAYNGNPATNGFGFYRDGGFYVARIGTFSRTLGLAGGLKWHHLAYVQSLGTESYYYDGKLVIETTADPLPLAPSGGFWLGGRLAVSGEVPVDLFTGFIDEVRYQSFNPLAAGAFEPTNFLITVPEPGTFSLVFIGSALILRRRKGG